MAGIERPHSGFPGPLDALRISPRHLFIAGLFVVSLLGALSLFRLSEQLQMALLFVFPAMIVAVMILKNPFIGVYLYFLYDFLRPYDFIPALAPLRLALVIEVLTLVSWVVHTSVYRIPIKWSRFYWVFFAWMGLVAVAVVLSLNNRLPFNVFQQMLVCFVMMLIAVNVVNDYGRLKKLMLMLMLIHLYYALHGIYNYAILQYSPGTHYQTSGIVGTGFLGDENDFAMAINVAIPFAFFMLQMVKGRIKRLASLGVLLVFMVAVMVSFSRGGWLGFVAVMLYCVLKSERRMVSLAYAGILALAFVVVAPASYITRLQTISQTGEGTAAARIRYWETGMRIFLDYPVNGVGPGNGGLYIPAYIRGVEDPGTEWGRAFHGLFPQIMAETGTLGLALYLGMLFLIVKFLLMGARNKLPADKEPFKRFMTNALIGSLIGYFVCSMFLSTAYYTQLWTIYTIAMIFVYNNDSISRKEPIARQGPTLELEPLPAGGVS